MLSGGNPKLSQLIWRIFTKGHGLTLQGDASDYLVERLSTFGATDSTPETLKDAIEYFASVYAKQEGHTNLVDRESLQATIEGIAKSHGSSANNYGDVDVRLYTHVVSAFETARWDYLPHENQFVLYAID